MYIYKPMVKLSDNFVIFTKNFNLALRTSENLRCMALEAYLVNMVWK